MNYKKNKIITLFFILCFLFSTFSVFGAELKYFDFSPDISGALNIYNSATPYQYFIPYDDYISGLDMWVENTGSAGTASFGLRDSNDNLISAQTITIPYLAKKWGGEKIHIQFDNSVNVVSTSTYKIKILSLMPKLKVYYGNLVNLQLHNANETQDFHIKPAYLGNEEQNYAFKFSLYEDGDILGPIISNINVSMPTDTKAKIDFNGNEPIDYEIIYWPTGEESQQINYSGNYVSCYSGIKLCSLEFSVLANKIYNYQLFAKDSWGNESHYDGTFASSTNWIPENPTSLPPQATSTENLPDVFGPVISDVGVVYLTENSVKIHWKTDEAANSSLLIGLNVPGQQIITSIGDATYELEHVLNSGDILHPDVNYYAKIASSDIFGNYSSHQFEFDTFEDSLTLPENPQEPPILPDNEPPPVINVIVENNAAEVNWNFNSLNNSFSVNGYRIDVFDKNKKLVKQVFVSRDTYKATINDLNGGDYYLVVYGNNNGVFEKVAAAEDFNIKQAEQKKIFLNFSELLKNPFVYIVIFGILIIAVAIIIKILNKKKLQNV